MILWSYSLSSFEASVKIILLCSGCGLECLLPADIPTNFGDDVPSLAKREVCFFISDDISFVGGGYFSHLPQLLIHLYHGWDREFSSFNFLYHYYHLIIDPALIISPFPFSFISFAVNHIGEQFRRSSPLELLSAWEAMLNFNLKGYLFV